jgi:hypothetical protein
MECDSIPESFFGSFCSQKEQYHPVAKTDREYKSMKGKSIEFTSSLWRRRQR